MNVFWHVAPSRPPGLVRELLASAGGKQPGGRERHYSRNLSQEITTKGRHAAKGDLARRASGSRARGLRGVGEWVCPFARKKVGHGEAVRVPLVTAEKASPTSYIFERCYTYHVSLL